jgi:hypothetical protein
MIRISVNMSHPDLAGQNPKKVRFVIAPLRQPFFLPRAHPPVSKDINQMGDVNSSVSRWLEVGGASDLYIEDSDFRFLGDHESPYMGIEIKSMLIDLIRKNFIVIEKDGVAMTPEQVMFYGS